MPVIVHDKGITFSSKFDFELLLWMEHPSLTVAEIEAGLALTCAMGCPGPGRARDGVPLQWWRIEPDNDLSTTLSRLIDKLAAATAFLYHVRTGGGHYGCRVICQVDFNAQLVLRAELLRKMASLDIDLAVHALDVETPETAEGMRQFLAIMNDPPWERRPVIEPVEERAADADDPP